MVIFREIIFNIEIMHVLMVEITQVFNFDYGD